VTPDQFGKTGHYTFVFHWLLEGVTGDQGEEINLPHYVRFEVGDRPYSKGARAGRLPWLTEITRAIGVPDLQPGDDVDPDLWENKRAKLSILLEERADGAPRNRINAAAPVGAKKAAPATAAKRVIVAPEDDESEAVPF
jgi:hypothetical protein